MKRLTLTSRVENIEPPKLSTSQYMLFQWLKNVVTMEEISLIGGRLVLVLAIKLTKMICSGEFVKSLLYF
jgi:hypothetical protein